MKRDYIEGREATKRFEKTMKTLSALSRLRSLAFLIGAGRSSLRF